MKTKFETKNGELYIDGKKVIKAWESYTGWYWFGVSYEDDENDRIWYGLVQGFEDEWGWWSENELKELMKEMKVWEIRKKDLPFAGRR